MHALITTNSTKMLILTLSTLCLLICISCGKEISRGRTDRALEHLASAVDLADNGKYNESISEWLIADHLLPNDPLVWADRSIIEYKSGHENAAISAAYDSIKYAKPGTAPSYAYAIGLLLDYQKNSEANVLIERALNDIRTKKNSNVLAHVLVAKAKLLEKAGKTDEALAFLDDALKVVPEIDSAYRSEIIQFRTDCQKDDRLHHLQGSGLEK